MLGISGGWWDRWTRQKIPPYAVRCPVLVRMKDDDEVGTSDMVGEIINVTPAVRGRRGGDGTFLYSILLSTDNKDCVLIEEDVPPECN